MAQVAVTVPVRTVIWTQPRVAGMLAGLSVLTAVLAVGATVAWDLEAPYLGSLVIATLHPVVGVLVVSRQPRNLVGWFLVAIGLAQGTGALMGSWATVALDVDPGALPGGVYAAWLADWLWIPGHDLLLTMVPLLFPDGRLPSRRWWPVAAFTLIAVAVHVSAPMTLISQIRLRTSYFEFYPDERLAATLGLTGYRMIIVAAVLCAAGLVWRLRRMPADERGPYAWFAGGTLVTVALLVPSPLITTPAVTEVRMLLTVFALPVGALVAIVRYRAYGIDVVVNRTLVYVTLSVLLAGIYLAAATVIQELLGGPRAVSAVAGAAATALVLTPARQRLQRSVDRLMYGMLHEPRQIVDAIGDRLEAIATADGALHEVAGEIAAALRLPYVAIETAGPAGGKTLVSTGVPTGREERVPLRASGERVGHLVAGPRRGQAQLTDRDRAALREIGRVAASAVRQLQLTDELRSARERLASDLEEERRRIRRDLHDGLGPTLATIVMGLEETRAVHAVNPDRADTLLRDLKTQAQAAIDDIRKLVYGLRPPALDDLGLRGAIQRLVVATERSGLTARLEAPHDLPELPAAIEVAAYRIVQEALTNVVRHAAATTVEVTLSGGDDGLQVRVADDGRGLPDDTVAGVGMVSIRERVHDAGGLVRFGPRPGGGTAVEARLPLNRP